MLSKVTVWRLQPDVAEHILLEAPLLAVVLLDGLIWRSHKTKAAKSSNDSTSFQNPRGLHSFLRMFIVVYFFFYSCLLFSFCFQFPPKFVFQSILLRCDLIEFAFVVSLIGRLATGDLLLRAFGERHG